MDCKKALTESGGDYRKSHRDTCVRKARSFLMKRADREAKEGVVIAVWYLTTINPWRNRQTELRDRLRSQERRFHQTGSPPLPILALEQIASGSLDELLGKHPEGINMTVAEKVTEQVGVIGEKIELAAIRISSKLNDGSSLYPHGQQSSRTGRT